MLGKLKNITYHGKNRTYNLWNANLFALPNACRTVGLVRVCGISKLSLVPSI